MRISGVAAQNGVRPSWLRKLERQGRIPRAARDRNGHRRYTPEDDDRIRQVIYPSVDETGPTNASASTPGPAEERIEVRLTRLHSINGTRYWPGTVKVPPAVAADLEANDARAAEADARDQR